MLSSATVYTQRCRESVGDALRQCCRLLPVAGLDWPPAPVCLVMINHVKPKAGQQDEISHHALAFLLIPK